MKKSFILLLLSVCILAASCKKDQADVPLQGSWERRARVGGMLPNQTYSAGNGSLIKFTDSDYETYEKGPTLAQE